MDWLSSLGVQSLLLFATTVFVVNATPGADMLLTFTNTMRHQVRGGLATALGISAGSLVHTALVVLGVAALIAASPTAYRLLQWAGAAYLVWIAVGLVRDGMRDPATQDASSAEIDAVFDVAAFRGTLGAYPSHATHASNAAGPLSASAASSVGKPAPAAAIKPLTALFNQGLMTNVLNPKVALFFLALLPQFVAPGTTSKWQGLAFLGGWFAVQGFVFLALFVRLVAKLRRWQPTPARRRALHVVAAMALVLIAVRLVVTGSAA
jgi:threonine/homoserine/homoserine lactone efflux protein